MKAVSVSIRPPVPGDASAVAALEALCNPQPWNVDAVREFLQPIDISDLAKKSREPFKVARVAVGESGALIGYVLATAVGEEAEMMVLGVHPDVRRSGTGRALLRDLLAGLRALRVASVFLEVRRGNKPAIALYRSLGFGEAGVRKGYYADTGEDALLLHVFLRG